MPPEQRCEICYWGEASEQLWAEHRGNRFLEGWNGGWGVRGVKLCLSCYREAIELRRKFEHGAKS